MSSVSAHSRSSQDQEHSQHYGNANTASYPFNHSLPPSTYRPPHPEEHSSQMQPRCRTLSPVQTQATYPHSDPAHPSQTERKQSNAIAPSLQIPRSVNDSQGSLSELAAQITCLFWFESWDVLQLVEESSWHILPVNKLASDAVSSTGFRKWVTTILSTTQVAQNVIILALLFIYRLKKINTSVRGKPGSEFRLLTVALMLGNKFLDDNTYTNKTWAEVSGINVQEVHIMEVEFLSNMKYNLFTSQEEWVEWQTLLGKFAAFFDKSTRPQPTLQILPPASSLYLPRPLPSPPISSQASPPFHPDFSQPITAYGRAAYPGQHGPTPAPSPMAALPEAAFQNPRKRSHDDFSAEPARKRLATTSYNYQSPRRQGDGTALNSQAQHLPRLTLPIPTSQTPSSQLQNFPQLPPLNVPQRSMAMLFPAASSYPQLPHIPAAGGLASQPPSQMHSNYQSRQQSPFPASAQASPTSAAPPSATTAPPSSTTAAPPSSTTAPHPPTHISPSHFLTQRNSPYRPVHNVSTLLYPPPTTALDHPRHDLAFPQMHYQPLGRPIHERQTGRLPYIAQNQWLDGNSHHAMTPVHQWPSFMHAHQPQQQQQS